ncbi:unnamed protein product [Rhizoctonia solani]|uniref:BTB domain-containing protein n=1 Tax=Rhizoctonia solani TaxID=456999 RepID=A0A8H3DTU3_9AGAM|nr:unnamed protein product [Rhizoctonia solani]
MSKRPSDAGISSQRLSQSAPFKRARKEPTPEPEVTIIDDGLSSISDSSSEAEEPVPPVRDPEFYYEDGSITFRAGDVLFKVHASLLKIESGDFEKKFDVPPKLADATKQRGTCDENPITIPDVKASQFRNLIEIIYRPHYLDISPYTSNTWQQFVFYLNVAMLANRFAMKRVEDWARPELAELVQMSAKEVSIGADKASESDESDEEEGHEDGDKTLVEDEKVKKDQDGSQESGGGEPSTAGGSNENTPNSTTNPVNPVNPGDSNPRLVPNPSDTNNTGQPGIANDANKVDQVNNQNEESAAYDAPSLSGLSGPLGSSDDGSSEEGEDEDEEMKDGESKSETILPPEEEAYPAFQLIDALFYAESVSDSSLQHDVRNVLQYHCVHPDHIPVDTLANLFKVPGLQEKDPSMFGFLFIVLLDQGNQVWKQDVFTRMDRMAFFSAQSYLTPFPDSLKTFVAVPLFQTPISAKSFAMIFSDPSMEKSCIEECYINAFTHWQEQFDEIYYADIANKETLAPIKALVTLPRRRLDLAEKLRASGCKHKCYLKLLTQVDRDVQGLYARLAEYYQGIE